MSYDIEKVKIKGKTLHIPKDAEGFVPEEALIKRFNSVVEKGNTRNRALDYDEPASVVLPIRMTPRQAAAWWESPNKYDIEYIDTRGPAHNNIDYMRDGESKKIHQNINVVCIPSEEREIREIIDRAYPIEERQKLVKDGPITFTVRPLKDASGMIVGRDIMLDRDCGKNNSTVVHEGTHLLRRVDNERTNKVTKTVDNLSIGKTDGLNVEESCTVAEQMARGENPSSGYYQFVQIFDEKKKRWRYPTENEALTMMKEDRALFTNGTNKGLSGKAAIESVNNNWANSHISRLKIKGSRRMAVNSIFEPSKRNTAKSTKAPV